MPCSRRSGGILAILGAAGAAGALWAACVSIDPTGPHAEAINGRFIGTLITVLQSPGTTRRDTSLLSLTLRDLLYRGRFSGFYRFIDGDSGFVDGTLYISGRVEVAHFGLWPPLTHVTHVSQLYPSCDFPLLGPLYIVNGNVVGDTLRLGDTTTVPCSGSAQPATFVFQFVGLRGVN